MQADHTQKFIETLVRGNKVMLFMKGNKFFPACGFSARSVQILKLNGADFETFDVLSDPDVRSGIKEYAQWPTIPQLYINGEFLGGSDIMMEMHENGELKAMIEGLKAD